MDIVQVLNSMLKYYSKKDDKKKLYMTKIIKLHLIREKICDDIEKKMREKKVTNDIPYSNDIEKNNYNPLQQPCEFNKICRKFYHKLCIILHPDKCGGKYDPSLFIFLQEGYENSKLYISIILLDYLELKYEMKDKYYTKLGEEINWLNETISFFNNYYKTH